MFFVTGRYSNRMEFKGGIPVFMAVRDKGRYSNRMEFKEITINNIVLSIKVDIATEWNLKAYVLQVPRG